MGYMRKIRATLDRRIIEKDLYYTYHALPTKKETKKRAKRVYQTPEQQKEINRRHAAAKLALKIANNFKAGDWYLTLTIAGKVPTKDQVKKMFDNFMLNLRRYYKRKGDELKYIAVLENMTGRGRPHGHMLMNAMTAEDMEVIKKYWTLGRMRIEFFGGDIDDCNNLASYFKKEDVDEHSGRIRTSTNLVNPVETKEKVKRSECYSTRILPPKGYHIHKRLTYQGYTKDGYPCQHIVFVRN
ncbi:rolling circle replication-associated protein [Anaerosinus massiliensis]|uniref:rolling circle replication-associated protein n=1 Tax=Massilibacillus massiliensis TaxID=1806837 RepID=UPI000DA60208|nr:hypothetical protein [Massilibacillus massiliensis]